MGQLSRVVLTLLVVALAPTAACGDLVTYNFSGTITSVTDSSSPFGNVGGITVGDWFTGTLTYDSNGPAPDTNTDPNIGNFLFGTTGGQMSVTIDGLTFSTGVRSYEVGNEQPTAVSSNGDYFNVVGAALFSEPSGWSGTGRALEFYFADTTGGAFSSDAFPSAPMSFDYGQILLRYTTVNFPGGSDSNVIIMGTMNVQGVPEPSSVLLTGLAVAMGAFRRLQRRPR